MNKQDITNYLKTCGSAEVYFTKIDGTDREMVCTLNPKDIPGSETHNNEFTLKETFVEKTEDRNDLCVAYDVINKGWRSFHANSVYEMWIDGELVIPEPIQLTVKEAELQGLI